MRACCAAGTKDEFADVGAENQALKDLIPSTRNKVPTEVRTNSVFFYHDVFDVMFSELADDFDDDLVLCSPEYRVHASGFAAKRTYVSDVNNYSGEEAYSEPRVEEQPYFQQQRANAVFDGAGDPVFDNMVDEPQLSSEPRINTIPFTSDLADESKTQNSYYEAPARYYAYFSYQAAAFQARTQYDAPQPPSYAQPSTMVDDSFNIYYYPQVYPSAYAPPPSIPLPAATYTAIPRQDSTYQKLAAPSQVLQSMKREVSMNASDKQSFAQYTSTFEYMPPPAQKPQAVSQAQANSFYSSATPPMATTQPFYQPIYNAPAFYPMDIENLIYKAVAANSQSINEYLARSYDLIYYQLKIIQMQEQQLYETRYRAIALEYQQRQNYVQMNAAALSLGQTRQPFSSYSIYQASPPKPSYYANAKLSLSSGFLIGSYGSRELFRIDLAQPNIIQYDELALRIVVYGPDGPLFIKAQTHDDYEKWVRNISASLYRRISAISQKAPSTYPKLLMMLDAQTRVLFVYYNGSYTPTKQFFVENCEVTIKRDREFGVVKVRCVDGKKFSFGDRIEVCEQWQQQFESVGGVVKFVS